MKRIVLLTGWGMGVAFSALADNLHWWGVSGSGAGDFEVATNWQEGKVPGVSDLAAVNNRSGKDWTVNFNGDVTNATGSLVATTAGRETLFKLNQHAWTTTNNLFVWEASGGRIVFTNGTLRTKSIGFIPTAGSPVTNVIGVLRDVMCETPTAQFCATAASVEGGGLKVSDSLSVGWAGSAASLTLGREAQCGVTNGLTLGQDGGATGELVNVNAALRQAGEANSFIVGKYGCGALTLYGGTTYIRRSPTIGWASTGVGTVTVLGGANTFCTITPDRIFVAESGRGTLLGGGGTNDTVALAVGNSANSFGDMTVTGGLWRISEHTWIGFYGKGVLTLTGGEMRYSSSAPVLAVGRNAGATGEVVVAGGFLNLNGSLWLGGGGITSLGRLTLAGDGVLRTKTIQEKDAAAVSQALFDGGTLQASAAGALVQTLDDVRLTAAGLVVDSAGFDVSVAATLQDASGEAGGITKTGAGTLTLAGARAATGPVSVLAGRLVVSNAVSVASGTSRIDGTLVLTGASRLAIAAGAALAGTGSVARVTLADHARLARAKAAGASSPLNVSDCVASGALSVDLSGYTRSDLLSSLPLLTVPSVAFVKPTSVSVFRDGVLAPAFVVRYSEGGGTTVLSVVYNSGTLLSVR